MRRNEVKKASIEIVDGLKCILNAQMGETTKQSCVPVLKKPINRFCKIARQTEKKFKKEDPQYEISRFLGMDATARKKMGVVCSSERDFPSCERAISKAGTGSSWDEYVKLIPPCKDEVVKAIREKPIEKNVEWSKNVESFETMRDWMHVSGYALPDYVWVTPRNMRAEVKKLFEQLSSEEIGSTQDLDRKKREIERW